MESRKTYITSSYREQLARFATPTELYIMEFELGVNYLREILLVLPVVPTISIFILFQKQSCSFMTEYTISVKYGVRSSKGNR